MHGRQVDKDMYLAQLQAARNFEVIKTIKGVQERHRLQGLSAPARRAAPPRHERWSPCSSRRR